MVKKVFRYILNKKIAVSYLTMGLFTILVASVLFHESQEIQQQKDRVNALNNLKYSSLHLLHLIDNLKADVSQLDELSFTLDSMKLSYKLFT